MSPYSMVFICFGFFFVFYFCSQNEFLQILIYAGILFSFSRFVFIVIVSILFLSTKFKFELIKLRTLKFDFIKMNQFGVSSFKKWIYQIVGVFVSTHLVDYYCFDEWYWIIISSTKHFECTFRNKIIWNAIYNTSITQLSWKTAFTERLMLLQAYKRQMPLLEAQQQQQTNRIAIHESPVTLSRIISSHSSECVFVGVCCHRMA